MDLITGASILSTLVFIFLLLNAISYSLWMGKTMPWTAAVTMLLMPLLAWGLYLMHLQPVTLSMTGPHEEQRVP